MIVKRSENRSKFPEKWGFPAGRTEKDIESYEDAALRELREETDLSGEVLRTGDPFSFEENGVLFTVKPFLVLVKSSEVSLSKENNDYKWISLENIDDFQTVPRIKTDLKNLNLDQDL